MFDFYEKRKVRNILYSKPVLVLLVIVALFLIVSVWGAYQKEVETRNKWTDRTVVLDELDDRKDELQLEIERLDTDRGVEAEIRSKFEVAKEGEEVIVIVEPPEEDVEVDVEEEKSFWQRFFGG